MKRFFRKMTIFLMMFGSMLINISSIGAVEEPEKVVYLTFDDGPTPKVTEKILDILKQEDVKATFFVVGKEIKQRESILQRMYDEGHSIGLHTYTHNFKEVYRNKDTFINEMEKTLDTVNEVLGEELDIKIIRFPGGSAGRLNENFLKALQAQEYKIFDWNVNLEDGVNPELAPCELLKNAKKCRDKGNRRIILAHCNSKNKSTCSALPAIIAFYKKEGYTFKAIDNETEPYYYKFNKDKQ